MEDCLDPECIQKKFSAQFIIEMILYIEPISHEKFFLMKFYLFIFITNLYSEM